MSGMANAIPWARPRQGLIISTTPKLLNFYFSTCFFQLSHQRFGVGLAYTFFNGLGSAIYQILGFFQTKTSQVLNNLNNIQLVGAGGLQDNVERSLFFNCRSTTACGGTSNRYSHSLRLHTLLFPPDLFLFLNFFFSQFSQ